MVSMIVPVYNGEKTIETCIWSILGQTYEDLEIVVIDDGSSDNTGCICKNLEEQDERVRYYYQSNQGVAAARAYGVKKSRGCYIGFADADDELLPDMIEKLCRSMGKKHADVAVCGYFVMDNYGRREIVYDDGNTMASEFLAVGEEQILNVLMCTGVQGFLWNKLFRRRFLEKRDWHYKINICEDLFVLCEMTAKYPELIWVIRREPLYVYHMVEKSATHDYGRLISKDHKWVPLCVYQEIEMLFASSVSCRILIRAQAAIIKLALEQIKQDGIEDRLLKSWLKIQARGIWQTVAGSDWTLREKLGWLLTILR